MLDTNLSDPQQLIQLFKLTLVGDTEQISQAEIKLKELSNHQLFLQHLLMIPKQKSLPKNIHKAAIIYINTYIKNTLDYNNYDKLLNISRLLFYQFGQPLLQIKLRRYLINSITLLISKDKSQKIKCIFYEQFLKDLQLLYHKLINKQNLDNNLIIYIGLSIQTFLIISVHITKQLMAFIRTTIIIVGKICQLLYEIAQSNMQKSDTNFNAIQIFQIMKIYSYTFKLYMKKLVYCDLQTVKLLFQPQLSSLLEKTLQFQLKNNQINTSIIFFTRLPINQQMVEFYHSVKADYMQSLGLTLRIIFQFFKNPITLSSHPFTNNLQLTAMLISSIYHLFQHSSYHKIKSAALLKLLQQILNTLLIIVKSNYYYAILQKMKKQLIEGVIFKILQFNQQDYDYMQNNPQQLINQILQIVDMDNTQFMKHRKRQFEITQQDEDIQNYVTLKTIAATLLTNFCKNIDGTLTQLLNFIDKYLYIRQQNKQNKYQKSLLLLILGIIRDLIYDHSFQNKLSNKQQISNVVLFITKQFQIITIPSSIFHSTHNAKNKIKSENLQYAMYLIILMKYLQKVGNNQNNKNNSNCVIIAEVIPKLYKVLLKIIMTEGQNIEEIIRIISYDIITTIMQCTSILPLSPSNSPFQQTQPYSLSFIQIFLTQLHKQCHANTQKLLQLLFNIYKYKQQEIYPHPEIVKQTLAGLSLVIQRQIEKEFDADGEVINKAWNIITDISACQEFISNLGVVNTIQQIVLKLSKYLSKYNSSNSMTNSYNNKNTYHWLQYDDHIIIAINSLLEINKKISPKILQIVIILINTIFCGKNHCKKYEGLFQTICQILYYGYSDIETMIAINGQINKSFISVIINIVSHILNNYQSGYQNNNNNQNDKKQMSMVYIQSLLILQDVIIIYGHYLPPQLYNNFTQQLVNKIDEGTKSSNHNNIIIGNMVGVLGLRLMIGYKKIAVDNAISKTNENLQQISIIILQKIIQNKKMLYLNNIYKIILTTLSQLLGRYHQKWIYDRITLIIQCILDIMILHKIKYNSVNNQNSYQQEQEQKISDLQKQYQSCLVFIKNNITNINELQYFKKKFKELKEYNNGELIQQIMKELPQKKINFLRKTMTTVNIGNQSRLIFKIKR